MADLTPGQHTVAISATSVDTTPLLSGSDVLATAGAAVAADALKFGVSRTEGLVVKVIDETLDLTALGAKFKALTSAIPAGSVILGVQGNTEAAVTAGGTTVTLSLGLNGSDPDKYGTVSGGDSLAQNGKIDFLPDWVVLSGAEQIDLCGTVTGGATLGDTNISAGSVRVRVYYLTTDSLNDA